jgi:hypothetical protein
MMNNNTLVYLNNLINEDKITITFKILDMEYPPFNEEKIEQIRMKMAHSSNLVLSRVSNRDIVD